MLVKKVVVMLCVAGVLARGACGGIQVMAGQDALLAGKACCVSVTASQGALAKPEHRTKETDAVRSIEPGDVVTGTTDYDGEHDLYWFSIEKDSLVEFGFGVSDSGDSVYGWDLDLIDVDGRIVNIGDQVSSRDMLHCYLKKGTYRIDIHSILEEECPYRLSFLTSDVVIGRPVVKKVTGTRLSGENSVKSVWIEGGSGCSGYQVKFSKKKNGKGRVYRTLVDAKDGGCLDIYEFIKGPKKQYVTVRPFINDAFGKKIWGKASKAKKFSLK